ncbi:MAG: radical SAM protein [Chloroflexaceae bacterium]|nr:radical SAM protein [Chloroflexaceae bacterium]
MTISDDLQANYSFDREGRLLGSFLAGVNYKRGLRGDILMRHPGGDGTKVRRLLAADERRQLLAGIRNHVAQMREVARETQDAEVCSWLDRALSWDVERLEAERDTFQRIYKPISILPPDQYLALVLQAAEGCSWNRCTFCTLYADRRFRVKAPAAFQEHVQAIKAFVGRGIGMRKSIFLGDANALVIPQPRLCELLQIVHQEFTVNPEAGLKGIYAFLDIFGAEQKSLREYRELRDAQVRRVYLGLESGDPTVFRLLNKPGSPAACIEAVRTIKAAGINVGVILLAGAGGDRLNEQHVRHSLDALAAMELGVSDLVYISPLIVPDDGPFAQQLRTVGGSLLPERALQAELEQLKQGARARIGNGAKATLYHIEEFLY